jgi:hypothetical protein
MGATTSANSDFLTAAKYAAGRCGGEAEYPVGAQGNRLREDRARAHHCKEEQHQAAHQQRGIRLVPPGLVPDPFVGTRAVEQIACVCQRHRQSDAAIRRQQQAMVAAARNRAGGEKQDGAFHGPRNQLRGQPAHQPHGGAGPVGGGDVGLFHDAAIVAVESQRKGDHRQWADNAQRAQGGGGKGVEAAHAAELPKQSQKPERRQPREAGGIRRLEEIDAQDREKCRHLQNTGELQEQAIREQVGRDRLYRKQRAAD